MIAYGSTVLFCVAVASYGAAVSGTSTATSTQSQTTQTVKLAPTATIYPINDKPVYIQGTQTSPNVSLNTYYGIPFAAPRKSFLSIRSPIWKLDALEGLMAADADALDQPLETFDSLPRSPSSGTQLTMLPSHLLHVFRSSMMDKESMASRKIAFTSTL